MGTTASMERNTNYILSNIRNLLKEGRGILNKIDRGHFIAVAAVDLGVAERTIKERIDTLEKAKRIDKRIWKDAKQKIRSRETLRI